MRPEGAAYVPGPDGVSPMFAQFLAEAETALARLSTSEGVANIATSIMVACDDAEERGALTKAGADRVRAKYRARGGTSAKEERAAIVRWLRTSSDSLALAIAAKIERGEHVK